MAVSRKKAAAPAVEEQQAVLFDAYREAALKAQASLSLQDGIVAGKAWAAFLSLYVPPSKPPEVTLPTPFPGSSR